MGLKAIIIEDEIQAITALEEELKTHCPNVEILGEARDIPAARQLLEDAQPELVFLDIQLKDGTAFDLLSSLKTHPFKIIFTTAYSQFALQALKISALDYLLKPIDGEELAEAVAKAHQLSLNEQQLFIKNYLDNFKPQQRPKKIALPTNMGFEMHPLDDIIRIQAEGNYVAIHFTNQRKLIASKTLKQMEELLHGLGFIRIHQSHLINIENLKGYFNKEGGYVEMIDKSTLPVSKRKKSQLLELLSNYNS